MRAGGASIVVPAYNANATLQSCVRSLLAQQTAHDFEVIVVASGDAADQLPQLEPDERLRVVSSVGRVQAAVARNRGAALATGANIVFADADVTASRGWLDALLEAGRGDRAVAGSVANGTPDSTAGSVEYLVEFFDLHPKRNPRTAWHGATCNLLVPRQLWERYGPFPEDMGGGEDTFLTVKLRQDGLFCFSPEAEITHHNRQRWRQVLPHQYELGLFAARLGRRSPYRLRPLVRYAPLAPLAAVGRVASLYIRVTAWTPRELPRALALLPGVAAAFAMWGAGLLVEGLRLDLGAARSAVRVVRDRNGAKT